MNDLYTQAMTYLDDMGLPRPESLKLVDTGHLHRIEITYLRPASDLPQLDMVPTSTGSHACAEMLIGDVTVSIYAERAA